MVLDCEQLPSSVGIPVSVTMAAAAGALRGAEDLGLSLAELSGRSNPHFPSCETPHCEKEPRCVQVSEETQAETAVVWTLAYL